MSRKINLSSILGAVVIAISTSLTACNSTPEATQPITNPTATTTAAKTENLPLVVATSTVICGLTKQIAGDTINLKCLIDPGSDPHVYEPKPDDRKEIESANLVLYGGYDFEPSLIKLIQASSNTSPKVAINEVAITNPLMGEHEHDHDEKTEKETKAEKEADPHVWNNAQNGIKIAQAITKPLCTESA